ncbi:hypothetical protein KDA_71420 [Dictyobacter alpinus]|uniref:Uncharacterized protein n=1 Tax=Dictyobacter alpinus TaxID=2014873 RepID=A0A402BJX9_9CHLR|nr:hypothetical protein KDA_71420 [Dictyobacter alpinus]
MIMLSLKGRYVRWIGPCVQYLSVKHFCVHENGVKSSEPYIDRTTLESRLAYVEWGNEPEFRTSSGRHTQGRHTA